MTNLESTDTLPPALARAFAPLHKAAFGTAIGVACALIVFGVTALYLMRPPDPRLDLGLLGQYFYGYYLSWGGAVIGAAWGFFVGFVGGWFAAFCRNLFIATWIFVTRERAALDQTRDFLDHI